MSTAHQIFAERLNVSSIWVRELARKGRIYPAHKVGKNWVFFDSSTVIRAFERTGRAPQKMILPHEELFMKQMMREMRYNLATTYAGANLYLFIHRVRGSIV